MHRVGARIRTAEALSGILLLRAISVALLLAVAGCARHGLYADDASSLIKHYRTDHCRVVEISAKPSDVAARSAADTAATLLRNVRVDRKVQTIVQSSFGDYKTESLTFRDGTATESAELTEMHYPSTPWSDKVAIQGCVFVPTRIEVSDIVLESSTTAHVLFTEHMELSPLGRSMDRYRLLAKINGSAPSEAHEFHFRVATLYFDNLSDGWVVNSIGDGT
jgi:hypothetical protein